MKRISFFMIVLIALTGCAAFKPQVEPTMPVATDIAPANMPNPASVFCEQRGNTLKIQTAADGSQSGICIFPDGSSCDEWAYYRGECGPTAQASPTPAVVVTATEEQASGETTPPVVTEQLADWWGVIKSTPPGAQFDDFFERQDTGQVLGFGIDSIDPQVQSQIKALRDSGKIVHLYGKLLTDIPDYNGMQIEVDRIEVEG